MSNNLDIEANRRTRKYSRMELFRRLLWFPASLLFRLTPRPLFGFRRTLLRMFGASIGEAVNIYASARIYMPWNLVVGDWSAIGEDALIYNLGEIRIGKRTTVSHRAHLCAGSHDYTKVSLPLLKLPIVIGDNAWICTDAFIGPGVTVGEGAVVGARSVVVKNIPAWKVVAGNPAIVLKDRTIKNTN